MVIRWVLFEQWRIQKLAEKGTGRSLNECLFIETGYEHVRLKGIRPKKIRGMQFLRVLPDDFSYSEYMRKRLRPI